MTNRTVKLLIYPTRLAGVWGSESKSPFFLFLVIRSRCWASLLGRCIPVRNQGY